MTQEGRHSLVRLTCREFLLTCRDFTCETDVSLVRLTCRDFVFYFALSYKSSRAQPSSKVAGATPTLRLSVLLGHSLLGLPGQHQKRPIECQKRPMTDLLDCLMSGQHHGKIRVIALKHSKRYLPLYIWLRNQRLMQMEVCVHTPPHTYTRARAHTHNY